MADVSQHKLSGLKSTLNWLDMEPHVIAALHVVKDVL